MNPDELYVSVDVETSGPIPGEYSLLSIGACLVDQPATSIYLEYSCAKVSIESHINLDYF